MGSIQEEQNNTEAALKFYKEASQFSVKGGFINEELVTSMQIGRSYLFSNNDKAMKIFNEIILKARKHGLMELEAGANVNLSRVYQNLKQWEKAEYHVNESHKLFKKSGSMKQVASSHQNLGMFHINSKNYKEARYHGEEALWRGRKINDKSIIMNAAYLLMPAYANLGKFEDALGAQIIATNMKDSLANEDTKRLALKQEFKYSYDKQKALDDQENKHKQLMLKKDYQNKEALAKKDHEKRIAIEKEENKRKQQKIQLMIAKAKQAALKILLGEETAEKDKKKIQVLKLQKANIKQDTEHKMEKRQLIKEQKMKILNAKAEAELARRNNLQYSLIFMGILIVFGIIATLGFVRVSPRLAEGAIFFAFLILFEFLLIFTEPYINRITDGIPIYTLLANATIALIIFPLHSVCEEYLKKKIVKT
jgi:hypothetical protein